MVFDVQHITAPDTDFLRIHSNDQDLKIYLIMVNHSVHNRPEIIPLYGQYGVVPT
jgi:hypothetical protein